MNVTAKDCRRMIRYWTRKLDAALARETVNVNVNVNAKEDEKGEEKFPPAPPIREEGKAEEMNIKPIARARVMSPFAESPVIDIHTPPTLELFLAWAKSHNITDEDYLRKWHDRMQRFNYWCDVTTGNPIKNWPGYFLICYQKEKEKRREREAQEEAKARAKAEKPKRKTFTPPTLEEVTAYCRERHNSVDPVAWWNFYASKGWMVGKNKMASWKNAVVTWEREHRNTPFDPKAAAFQRQEEEAAARKRRAVAIAARILGKSVNGGGQ